MPTRIRAIAPKNEITANFTEQRVRQYLQQVARDFKEEMQEYPPIKPWKHGTPKSGPRAYGRRTLRYAKGWNSRPQYTKNSVTIINSVPYAVFVGGSTRAQTSGRHQAKHMGDRGWKSVTNVSQNVSRRNRRRLERALLPYRKV